MKRRNTECGKIRRPAKRSKLTEGMYGSTFLYFKFLLVWALVLLADFILEFRFEYLWPFWLLLRSVYDSFKYQGLAFSVFFVFIALTSDMICFLFIPVQWLFFAASTYVWVQYVWHTDRGVCLPTISLWLLFVYIEASVRLKELKNLPFNLDLCRPFAAHCIGYPVVTLGFGFKSFISYKMRLRKQKDVARENDFYMELLLQALPSESSNAPVSSNSTEKDKGSCKVTEEAISNSHYGSSNHVKRHSISSNFTTGGGSGANSQNSLSTSPHTATKNCIYSDLDLLEMKQGNSSAIDRHEYQYMEKQLSKRRTSVNDYDESEEIFEKDKTSFKSNCISLCSPPRGSNTRWSHQNGMSVQHCPSGGSKKNKNNNPKELSANNLNSSKDEHMLRLSPDGSSSLLDLICVSSGLSAVTNVESPLGSSDHSLVICSTNYSVSQTIRKIKHRLEADIKRLKADLQSSHQCEQELRTQIHCLMSGERSVKNELAQLQRDNENLQNKLHSLVTIRQQDKQTISQLEKKLQDERKIRSVVESQLSAERKAKKSEETAAAARAVALATSRAGECTESCKARRRDLESDIKQLRRELKLREDQLRQAEREAESLHQYKDSHGEAEVLMSALSAMQDKNAHLENSLSAETRLKLDLFSALGEAKRQLEISQALQSQKDKEIEELKSKIAEVMAVMPVTTGATYPSTPVTLDSLLYSPKFLTDTQAPTSSLDPKASAYNP